MELEPGTGERTTFRRVRSPEPLGLDPHDRWVLADRLARRLGPAAWARGGYASAALTVAVADLPNLHPAVVVALGAPPAAGLLREAPLLVVELAPDCAPSRWLRRGARAVWSLGADAVVVSTGSTERSIRLPCELRLPGARAAASLRLDAPLEAPRGHLAGIG